MSRHRGRFSNEAGCSSQCAPTKRLEHGPAREGGHARANDAGAALEVVNLYALDPFMGCRSCFACKAERSLGRCVYKDGLAGTLEHTRAAEQYPALGYDKMTTEHSDTIERFVGPVSLLVIGNTQQVSEKAYGRFDWTMFDSEAKIVRHDTV